MPKYPNVTVKLLGQDGNTFAILANVARAMRAKKIPKEEIDAYLKEAMAGDYDNLLRITLKW